MGEIIARGLAKRLAQHRVEGAGSLIAETAGHRGDILPSRQPHQGVGELGLMPPVDKAHPRLARKQPRQCAIAGAGPMFDHSSSFSRLPGSCKSAAHTVLRHLSRGNGTCRGRASRVGWGHQDDFAAVPRNPAARGRSDSFAIRRWARRVLVIGGVRLFILSALRR